MQSQQAIRDLSDFDILFVGNVAAVTACAFLKKQSQSQPVKIALLHFSDTIAQPSLLPLNDHKIKIKNTPSIEIIHQKINSILPEKLAVEIQGGKRLNFKLLVYGQDKWLRITPENIFGQALKSHHSKIFSNIQYFDCSQLNFQEGNFVFFVQKKPNSFKQNYPFLYFYYILLQRQAKMNFTILLQGNSFFPNCPYAHQLLQQQLKSHKFRIVYNAKIQRVDFLRRSITCIHDQVSQIIPYEVTYCLFGQNTPQILCKSRIDPYKIHQKYLYNRQFPQIYILGADLLPTTHSFLALNHQLHRISSNLSRHFDHLSQPQQPLLLSPYQGQTRIKLYLSNKEMVTLTHNYSAHQYQLQKVCGCLARIYTQYIQSFLIEQFYNLGTYGMGYFLWSLENTPLEAVQVQQRSKECEFKEIIFDQRQSEIQSSYFSKYTAK